MKMCVVGKSLDFGHAGSSPAPGTKSTLIKEGNTSLFYEKKRNPKILS